MRGKQPITYWGELKCKYSFVKKFLRKMYAFEIKARITTIYMREESGSEELPSKEAQTIASSRETKGFGRQVVEGLCFMLRIYNLRGLSINGITEVQ